MNCRIRHLPERGAKKSGSFVDLEQIKNLQINKVSKLRNILLISFSVGRFCAPKRL